VRNREHQQPPDFTRLLMSALIAVGSLLTLACGAKPGTTTWEASHSVASRQSLASSLPPAASGPQDEDDGTETVAELMEEEAALATSRLAAARSELAQAQARAEACWRNAQAGPPDTSPGATDYSYLDSYVACDMLRNRTIQLETTLRVRELEESFARMACEPGGLEKLRAKARQLGIIAAGRAVERVAWQQFLAQERATYVQYYDSIGRNPYPTPPVGPIGMDKPSPRE
jgi:hypothetical protein